MNTKNQSLFLALLLSIALLPGPFPQTPGFCRETDAGDAELRGLWVTRWDFSSPGDIARIFALAREHHFNTIFFQIRGAGSVYFRSTIEPSGWLNSRSDSSWDPLATAVHYARELGLQLHAWMNVYPGSNGNSLAENASSLYRAHPEWFVIDEEQRPQAGHDHYFWLSPTHPRVQAHLLKLVEEIIDGYAIDGLHLDYIRYPGPGYSYDEESILRFLQRHGSDPRADSDAWDDFRRDAITELLTKIYSLAHAGPKDIAVSCAVVKNLHMGKFLYFQDVETWLRQGIVDFIVPMIYTPHMTLFRRLVKSYSDLAGAIPVYPGMIVANNAALLEQVYYSRQAGLNGHCLFAWKDLFDNGNTQSVRILKNQIYRQTAPKLTWPENHMAEVRIDSIAWLPDLPAPGQTATVTCTLIGSDLPAQQLIQPWLLWSDRPFPNNSIRQSLFERNSTDWKTTLPVPNPDEIQEIYFQIKVLSHSGSDSAIALSPMQRMPILPKEQRYRFFESWGPLLQNAEYADVDLQNRIWVAERGSNQVRIIDPNGRESAISPIRQLYVPGNAPIPVTNVTGIACDATGAIWLALYANKGLLAKINSFTGKAELVKQVTFFPGELDVDSAGTIFVIEQDGPAWHVFNSRLDELSGSPIFGGHLNQGIAVSPAGDRVYIACQAEGTVHCWQGTAANARADYRKKDDLPISGVGMGLVATDDSGRVFISLHDKNTVARFDPRRNNIDYLYDTAAPQRIIKGIAVEPGGRRLYFVEWGVMSPTRLQKWIRLHH
ncbi:MAG: family 10 glycosylhydrolase [Candidatus Zhuqueibacterota bacterium]